MNWTKDSEPFSRRSAEKEFESRTIDICRITTVKWGHSDFEHTLHIDDKYVLRNTYEITLNDFVEEWMEHFKRHPDEDIIKIENLSSSF